MYQGFTDEKPDVPEGTWAEFDLYRSSLEVGKGKCTRLRLKTYDRR